MSEKRALGAGSSSGDDDTSDDDGGSDGDDSSSDAAGLGGREDCINCSSVSMHSSTMLLSVSVTFLRESITLSRAESCLTDEGEEVVEPELEEEEGEGVSRTGIMDDSMLGRSVVMILDTAIRDADQELRPE